MVQGPKSRCHSAAKRNFRRIATEEQKFIWKVVLGPFGAWGPGSARPSLARHGSAQLGLARQLGSIGPGLARLGSNRGGLACLSFSVRHDKTWLGSPSSVLELLPNFCSGIYGEPAIYRTLPYIYISYFS